MFKVFFPTSERITDLTRRRLLLNFFLVVSLFALASCSQRQQGPSQRSTDNFHSDGKLTVKVEKLPGCATRRGEVTGVVDAPTERVWKVISDYNQHKNFMPGILECFAIDPEALKLIEGISADKLRSLESEFRTHKTNDTMGEVVYLYGVGDFPWPMSNKRYILKVVRDRQRWTAHATMVIGQMKVNESSWELEPCGPDGSRTRATYRILLDPGVPAPGFAVNMATSSTLPKVIEALRKEVRDPSTTTPGKPKREHADSATQF